MTPTLSFSAELRKFNTAKALAGVFEGQRDETVFKLACKLRNADVPTESGYRERSRLSLPFMLPSPYQDTVGTPKW